jgi:hypothetical protein
LCIWICFQRQKIIINNNKINLNIDDEKNCLDISFVAEGPLQQFQIDLIYMPKSWFDNGYKYIFACIDVFSKKADMIPRQRTNNKNKSI